MDNEKNVLDVNPLGEDEVSRAVYETMMRDWIAKREAWMLYMLRHVTVPRFRYFSETGAPKNVPKFVKWLIEWKVCMVQGSPLHKEWQSSTDPRHFNWWCAQNGVLLHPSFEEFQKQMIVLT